VPARTSPLFLKVTSSVVGSEFFVSELAITVFHESARLSKMQISIKAKKLDDLSKVKEENDVTFYTSFGYTYIMKTLYSIVDYTKLRPAVY
jgi:hypothetical protein